MLGGRLFVIVALVLLLVESESPLLCAGIYGAMRFLPALVTGVPFAHVMAVTAVSFGLSYGFFWLLNRFEDSSVFWVILIGGIAIGLI